MNYKILVQYDGTRYEGWQRQERTESTIQGKIEAVLSKMCGEEVQIQGAGRTDAGVHAKEQVANVHLKEQVDPQEVKQYLNRYLPEDIAVSEVREVPERFHSRLNATGKIYVYRIATGEVKRYLRGVISMISEKSRIWSLCAGRQKSLPGHMILRASVPTGE